MKPLLLPLLLVSLLAGARARAAGVPPAGPVTVSAAFQGELAGLGWKAAADGALSRRDAKDARRVPAALLKNAGFVWIGGRLDYAVAQEPVEASKLGRILDGLADFAAVARFDPKSAGATLARWGLPPEFDGKSLLNPDGSATYPGLMLYRFYVTDPGALARLSDERLAEALARFDDAYAQAFSHQAPDVAADEIRLVDAFLAAPVKPGEKALALRPYPDVGRTLAKYRGLLEADLKTPSARADAAVRGQDERALAALRQVGTQRYETDKVLVPPPPDGAAKAPPAKAAAARPAPVSLSSSLPAVLSALDRVNGRPLTPDQQRNLIESFPMGELVWRLGVQNLWRQGLTGRGVKVAIVDQGVAPHPELDGAVKSRQNFTTDRGAAAVGPHGTHVAGIIHALAPDAQIRSYAALVNDDGSTANPKLAQDDDGIIIAAIRKAVADGNQIINLSLGGQAPPSDPLARVVDHYARQGIIFAVAAGNERGDQSVESPSDAPGALTAGSLNVDGRMSDYSSFGLNYDPRRMKYVIKDVFMTPGQNIRSTLPGGGYGTMSGTSMATPALNGIVALLKQAADYDPAPGPVAAALRIKDALRSSAAPMDISTLPPDVPLSQTFLVVDPVAAADALRAAQARPVAKR
ncbi:MAG: S8 family serine peptidase [Elusimicrobia bacterium]|nr:S8 family serine peptidase [Elusimicrobiota bacterium]